MHGETLSTAERLPLHPELEDAVSDPRHLSTLSDPHADPRLRESAALAMADELVQAGWGHRGLALLKPCLNGERKILTEFLESHGIGVEEDDPEGDRE